MRIDRLEIENFKCFEKLSFDLNPHFTLFVGENGSGKTSVLEALAIAASVWLVSPPDPSLSSSCRNILETDVRLLAEVRGDRTQFVERNPTRVTMYSWIHNQSFPWKVQFGERQHMPEWPPQWAEWITAGHRLFGQIAYAYRRDAEGEPVIFPVVAHYGAGRAWPSDPVGPISKKKEDGPARRWAAFKGCFSGRIHFDQLDAWFRRETLARGSQGRWRPGFEIIQRAIVQCLPGADRAWFDADRDEVIVSIEGEPQPLSNLSAGQRMMATLAADIAIKAVTQNAFLVPSDELRELDESLPRVLAETPGIVLIDELDVHLHPKWQRRVASDLKRTFPAIQFVCTSHSPQIIGELKPDEIRVLDHGKVYVPPRSFGIDSSRILEDLMASPSRDESVRQKLSRLFHLIDLEDFTNANAALVEVEVELGPDDPEVIRARSLIAFLQSTI